MNHSARGTERGELPGPHRFESYLLRQGWRQKPFERKEVVLFEGPDDDEGVPILQLLPRSRTAADYQMRAEELLRALSVIENRAEAEILAAILEDAAPKFARPEMQWFTFRRFSSVSILALIGIGSLVFAVVQLRNAPLVFWIALVLSILLCSIFFSLLIFMMANVQGPVSRARGVCVAGDAMIETVHGSKRIDQIRRGDSVWSWDPAPALRATGYHSFLTARGWVRCNQLQPGDCLATLSPAGQSGMSQLARTSIKFMDECVYSLHIGYPCTFVCGGVVAHSFTALRAVRSLLSA